ncbi:XRE family transcriptional regulator [Neisseria weixii]|uniref:XRE family transcriptional regulator n=1 Tax=Neisseria weixii TaxID=1853276 RepID=A0A3N4MJ21_9NEIS|nr:LexA family transcriptional regulator [Neisseria weixii]RPD83208.1 XRE family transcriptional regulator [Neisseria weixii]RPD89609.1 XRE family transcriptional regulator [Neisseria weixii]
MNYDLAKWVSSARKQSNLTQEELAEAIGFSGKGSISAIEKGRNKPTFDVMVKIAEVCNYPLPYQNQIIHNNANHIQVGGNNFGNASYCPSNSSDIQTPVDLENISQTEFIKPFAARVPNDDLCDEGIFKNDILLIDPNVAVRHGNFVLVLASQNRGLIAKLLIDLKNQHFLKYNENKPEIRPEDVKIIGVVMSLSRAYV